MYRPRSELAKYLTEKSEADVPLVADNVSVLNGVGPGFSSLAYAVGTYSQTIQLLPAPSNFLVVQTLLMIIRSTIIIQIYKN